jgi:voltage-gated sodium channel
VPDERVWKLPYQQKVEKVYTSFSVQIGVAALIFGNFLVSALEKQLLPTPDSTAQTVFTIFEWIFCVLFLIELIVNMYGSWLLAFWKSGWNIFDFVIVLISTISLIYPQMPGIVVLRLFRAFRVFRLFKRIPSLRKIVVGVMVSLPGVGNAFVILGLIMAIWSIIGVEFFREDMDEEFGNFAKGMLTMFQVMTLDSWASNIARPLIFQYQQYMAAPFFISYVFIAGIVLANVVVAVLLEKYLTHSSEAEDDNKDEEEATNAAMTEHPELRSATPELPQTANGQRKSAAAREMAVVDLEDLSQGSLSGRHLQNKLSMSVSRLQNDELRKGIELVMQRFMTSEAVFQKGHQQIVARIEAFNTRLSKLERTVHAKVHDIEVHHPNTPNPDTSS